MKKLLLFLALLCLLCTACNRNIPEGSLPYATNQQDAAEIYVLRSTDGVFWARMPLNITFNNHIIARLGTGEDVHFTANYGFHDLGISDQIIQFPFERGRTYYFLAAPDDSAFGFGLTVLSENAGRQLVQRYSDVNK